MSSDDKKYIHVHMYIKIFYIKLLSLPDTELVVSLLLTVTINRPRTLTRSCLLIVQGVA